MQKLGRIPVLLNGRIKPLDTVARTSLLIIHGKQTLATDQGTFTAMDWLAEVLMKPDDANQRKIFVIRNSETLIALGLNPEAGKYFSFRELLPHLQEMEQQATLADKVDAQLRSSFQRDILKLYERISLYHRLENSLEVAGTVNFKSQIDDLLKNIKPSPVPMETAFRRRRCRASGSSLRPVTFFPFRLFRLTTILCSGARWEKASSFS